MMDTPFLRSHWNSPSSVRAIPVQHQTKPSPKVVSIPVHFFGSNRTRSDSAVKIQKVFRGFLVRKNVKKIAAISREVEEIEKRISEKENVELIRRDSNERLKINEMLMSLLFRLDSVRGVDSGVRDCRKKVIKKAIALQERIDLIVVTDNNNNDDVVAVEEKQVIVENDNVTVPEESVGTNQIENDTENEECVEKEEENVNVRDMEVFEKMMKDNERMMSLMGELVEKNEKQTRLISSLSQRVEQLERAFVCEKLRRKKKRQVVSGTGDCFQT